MSKGYPDWFGTSIWPKYGTPIQTTVAPVLIQPGISETLISISSQGVLFALEVTIIANVLDTGLTIQLNVDGEAFTYFTVKQLLDGSDGYAGPSIMKLKRFALEEGAYYMSLIKEVPFRNSFILYANNTNLPGGRTMSAGSNSIHYIVT